MSGTRQRTRQATCLMQRVCIRIGCGACSAAGPRSLAPVQVLLRCMDVVESNPASEETVKTWSKKMAPPLVTLLSAEPEVQYVALRNINLIVQRRPGILTNEVKVFFCKYNDPLYVKMEKLEIMIRLANDKNIDQVGTDRGPARSRRPPVAPSGFPLCVMARLTGLCAAGRRCSWS
jgi:AP-1 complex subunit beta-1